MVVAPKAGEAQVKPIDVWANQTQKSASLLGLDSPLFGATTIEISWWRTDMERGRWQLTKGTENKYQPYQLTRSGLRL